jgi:diguanylate cyclase (GGDEF)-like protein
MCVFEPLEDPTTGTPPATEKVDALNRLAWELRVSDPREGVRVAAAALASARAAGYARGEAYALRNLGGCRSLLLEHEEALADLAAAREIFDALGDAVGTASTLNRLGSVYCRQGDFAAALATHGEALRLQREAGDLSGEGDSLNLMGNVHYSAGNLLEALEHYSASLRVEESLGAKLGVSHCLNNIGNIHGQLGDFQRALEFHTRAVSYKRDLGDRAGEAIGLTNVGSSYEQLGDFPRALACYQEALDLARSVGERSTEIDALRNMGDVHQKLGDRVRALSCYREGIGIAYEFGAPLLEVECRIGAGRVLTVLDRTGEATSDLEDALALAERVESKMLVYEAHLALSEAREASGDVAEALRHFKEYHRIEDEVFNTETERRIQAVIAHAEIEQSQREAELLRVRNDELIAANDEKAHLLGVLRSQAEELDRLSREDSLTGLFNRRHIDMALAMEWERACRFGRDLSVIILDIDHFKQVNDELSHAAGDRVLAEVSRILHGATRGVDVVGRWGGEEFVLVLVETPAERAAVLAEKLRESIELHDWSVVGPALRVTASFGVADNRGAESPDGLLATADARLYTAKRAGRNRVVVN